MPGQELAVAATILVPGACGAFSGGSGGADGSPLRGRPDPVRILANSGRARLSSRAVGGGLDLVVIKLYSTV